MPKPIAVFGTILMFFSASVSVGAAQSTTGETRFTFCNRQPITLQVYMIQSVSAGGSTSLIAGNLANQGVRFEGRGWRELRPDACLTASSILGMTVALSLNYDFGTNLEPIRVAAQGQDENPSGIGYVPIEAIYCVGRFEDADEPVIQRDDLEGFRPRSGTSCPSTRLEQHPFSIRAFVSRGSNYTLEY